MEVIEASVLYPAIILNVLKAHYDIDAEQDVVSDSSIFFQEHPLTPTTSSLTSCTTVSPICFSRLIFV